MTTDEHAEIDAVLDKYPYIVCRRRGHKWPETACPEWEIEGIGPQALYVNIERCARCNTKRVERANTRFKPLHTYYDYSEAEGYRAQPGVTFTRADIREWELKRRFAPTPKPTPVASSSGTGTRSRKRAKATTAQRTPTRRKAVAR